MSSTVNFYKNDFISTLFPLNTNLILIEQHTEELSKYIYEEVLNESKGDHNFLPQQRVFATKPKNHLRRTVKLDPVAEFFFYDIVYRNKNIFRSEVSLDRRSFGYKFKNGNIIFIHDAYSEYKKAVEEYKKDYKYFLKFDIASYFNSLYHHDVCHWFNDKNISDTDSLAFGKFCREINAGRSVDFMPHGIYPAKMIGNEFLKFIDLNAQIKSSKIVRFMDDFILFDNNLDIINKDFIKIQQLLGSVGLNINPSKTHLNDFSDFVDKTLSDLRETLKQIIKVYKEVPFESGVMLEEVEREVHKQLNRGQVQELLNLLKNENIEESDAELILFFLRSNSNDLLIVLPVIFEKFPNLIKQIHSVSSKITDKDALGNILLSYINQDKCFLEYELFWIVKITEDFLVEHTKCQNILIKLLELSSDYRVVQAKILKIPINKYGLKEIRSEFLKTGQSDWLSWSSAVGTRNLKNAERNYMLDYFSKCSPLNYLIASCIKKI